MIKVIKALFTDKDWDADASKTIGFILVVCGIVGFFCGKDSFQWVIGTGATLLATGKVSEELTNK